MPRTGRIDGFGTPQLEVKQVIQDFKSGRLAVEQLPPPALRPGGVLVRTCASLISAGTERSTVSVGKASLVGKARQRPDLVRQVVDNVRREGLVATYNKVQSRLDALKPLGYSAAGVVAAVGAGVTDLSVGDRVACAGAGYASHAEVLFVPRNLCARIPDGVSFEAASYTTVGAIAMQGVRQADVRLGENVAVIGLGLIGQLVVQLLNASGCRVAGVDLDPNMVERAAGSGAGLAVVRSDDVERQIDAYTGGLGADAVIIAATSRSRDPIELAGRIARDRARVVVVGMSSMDVPRTPYYEKELEVRLSRSYGPGRYDPAYEEHGHDYPVGYVRWTEGRNMAAFLDLVASGKIDVERLTTHRFTIDRAVEAYDAIEAKSGERPCGIVLSYADQAPLAETVRNAAVSRAASGKVGVAFVGAGNFATATLLPPLKKLASVRLTGVATSSGVSALSAARKFGFAFTATGIEQLLEDEATTCVFVATRHNLHHSLAVQALAAGRAVFVEKPLALNVEGLHEVVDAARASRGQLMVGFNRRFAPLARQLRSRFAERTGPAFVTYRVNAGFLPKDHWTQDPVEGGGRIIGEACHFIDFIQFLTGAVPIRVSATSVRSGNARETDDDSVAITLEMSDGSVGTVLYVALGDKRFPKERCEVFADGCVGIVDDYRSGRFVGAGRDEQLKGGFQDKGHAAEIGCFIDAVRTGGEPPIGLESLIATTLASFAAVEAVHSKAPVDLRESLREFGVIPSRGV